MMTQSAFQQLDDDTAERLANVFGALSDPTRLRILAAVLESEVNVGELAKSIGLSKSAMSHQLRGLRDKRLVRARRQGQRVYVALDDDHVAELFRRGLDHVLHG
jgi:DNA-binding transcriptional ArsR family regulator